MALILSLFSIYSPLSTLFHKFFSVCFGMPHFIYFYFMFNLFHPIFKGWTVKFWVCVAEGIKGLCSLQVVTAHSPLGNKVTSPRRYNRRSHCGHSASTAAQLSQPGCVVFTKFPLVCNILLFDVRVFLVHECIWLGWDPWEENLPPYWNMLWKLFKLVLDRGNCHTPRRDWLEFENGKRQDECCRQMTKST